MKLFRSALFALCVVAAAAGPAQAQLFQAPASQADSHEYRQAAAGDVNGDGKTDIVALKIHVGAAAVWEVRINDGSGNFVTTEVLGAGVDTVPTIADADGDGHADVLLPLSTAVRVFWGSGDGRFSTSTDLSGSAVSSVAVGHLNGDDYPDLAISHRSHPIGVTVRYGAGGRQFDAAVPIADVAFASQVAIANIDGDSMPDLFVLATRQSS